MHTQMYHIECVYVYNLERMPAKYEAASHSLNKHQQKTEATRRKLLNAGFRVFARDGFEASRIEDIAAESGHTRGAFYANFETKEDLFFALLEQQATKRLKELQELMASLPTPERRLQALREYYVKRAKDRPWVMLTLEFKLLALRRGPMRAKLAAAHERIRSSLNFEVLRPLLPKYARDPEAKKLDKVLCEVILSGLVLEHAFDPKRISKAQVAAMLGRMFDLLISAPSRSN
jgi:AcrR family transcriptional regulator